MAAPRPRPRCHVVNVDGLAVRVRGLKPPTELDQAALAEIVRAVRKLADERVPRQTGRLR